ncbi:MAG: multicopper oxidase domain-containing protein [Lewinellaceae bacterium]|nr:multicopper oxidase domain-containing protein [Lewinellaceae bacterium]
MLSKISPHFLFGIFLIAIGFSTPGMLISQTPPPTLDPAFTTPFASELPVPDVIDMTNGGNKVLQLRKTTQWLGIYSQAGTKLYTNVYGYGLGNNASYPGPTIVAAKGTPINIKWQNKLPNGHLMFIDYSLHMAQWKTNNGIPIVTHLHGGHVPDHSDGNTEAWYTRDWKEAGPWYHYFKATYGDNQWYHYPMDQEAATTWYHDHALGITRLNVYAGLAGFFLQTDANEQSLIANGVLPDMGYGLAVQDRMFLPSGMLYMPAFGDTDTDGCPAAQNGNTPPPLPFPSIVAEFFGDFILVNGMAWPFQNVEPRKYRYRILNGSDSRFYNFQLSNNMDFMVIGTDDGFLQNPVEVRNLLMGPGERYDVILDFSSYDGTDIILQNTGPDGPFMGGNYNSDVDRPTGKIMMFKVGTTTTAPNASVNTLTNLRSQPFSVPGPVANTRKVVLFEGRDQFCRLRPQLGIYDPNSSLNGSLLWDEMITENPALNTTEAWEIYNTTGDVHPMHLHLVSFEIEGRYSHSGEAELTGTDPVGGSKNVMGNPGAVTKLDDAEPWENGPKDMALVYPGQMTKVIARFDKPGAYVWHCHILSHEDHEMMRPLYVGDMPANIPHGMGGNQAIAELFQQMDQTEMGQNFPNPFADETNILFSLPGVRDVRLELYDQSSNLVGVLANGVYPAGQHQMVWDGKLANGQDAPSGIYYYKLVAGEQIITRRLSLVR